MNDLKTYISQKKLAEIESDIKKEIDDIVKYPDNLKATIMLSIIAESCIEGIMQLDTNNFAGQIEAYIDKTKEKHDRYIKQIERDIKRYNTTLCNIGDYDTDISLLKSEAEEALKRYRKKLSCMSKENNNNILK